MHTNSCLLPDILIEIYMAESTTLELKNAKKKKEESTRANSNG
jgi:hypothetical protein